ncbi:MAG: ribosomal protein S18-alanine N-acetyltransferase [Anaerolineae bacterium]|nr:ribosomal protein S18-alanine N-acetyltransferase [Anaerolineae bacterium]MDW8071457.1 ribosomal protein S18-alanine N-acetyltransferase [Anaerolineae bacterium]
MSTPPAELPFYVRPMQLADVPAVMAIEHTAFSLPWPEGAYRHEITKNELAHYYVLCFRSPSAPQQARVSSWWRRLRDSLRPEAAAPREVLLGYGGFWMMVDEAHISTIAVRQDVRGRGLGEFLLLGLLDEARRLGAQTATLEVRVSNTVARALYTKYGFRETGRRVAYYHDNNEDAIIMTTPVFTVGNYWPMIEAHRTALLARLRQQLKEGWQVE